MNYFPRDNIGVANPSTINLRCPACRHAGAFGAFHGVQDVTWLDKNGASHESHRGVAGMRQCPNLQCRNIVFVVGVAGKRSTIYPPEVIDFDATNLPPKLLTSLEEAIKCHAAGCYRASALMVRRVLEELCDDKKATGPNLKARITSLNGMAVIPADLLNAADELRILGNDAAHVEAKDYDAIGQNESELAIELAKELLKAVYQYASLVSRLQALKKPPSP